MDTATGPVSDIAGLKTKLKATWMAGDYDKVARIIAAGAEDFIARLHLSPGVRLLDVACGTGNLSVPAARAGAIVTGVDIAPNLLATARERAQAEDLQIQFDEGDAEALPYPDASFDVVVTMFGAMFAPQPQLVAAEFARVCKSGGRLAIANWTPAGFVGQMFKVIGRHVAPPPMPSPLLWGDEATVRERLRDGFSEMEFIQRELVMDFPMTPPEAVEFFRTWYGPMQRAFAALHEEGQSALRRDLEQLWTERNSATDGTTRIVADYLEVRGMRL